MNIQETVAEDFEQIQKLIEDLKTLAWKIRDLDLTLYFEIRDKIYSVGGSIYSLEQDFIEGRYIKGPDEYR